MPPSSLIMFTFCHWVRGSFCKDYQPANKFNALKIVTTFLLCQFREFRSTYIYAWGQEVRRQCVWCHVLTYVAIYQTFAHVTPVLS